MTALNSEGLEKARAAIIGNPFNDEQLGRIISAYLAALPPVDGLEVHAQTLRDAARRTDMECAPEESDLWAAADALSQASSVIAGLKARIAELEAAIDSAEIAGGLTENGNLWRFWSQKARETASKTEARISSLEEQNKRLREALKDIQEMTDADDPESYRSDDREGCLDTVHSRARKLLEDHNG